MRFLIYTPSILSGRSDRNAHFTRGLIRALQRAGHLAEAAQPGGDPGEAAAFARAFPSIRAHAFDETFDHAALIGAADVVIVQAGTPDDVVARIGRMRRRGGRYALLFQSGGEERPRTDIADYDGVLAPGEAARQAYSAAGWGRRAFLMEPAVDTELFRPHPELERHDDLLWVGSWREGPRAQALEPFLMAPTRDLGLRASAHGAGFPPPLVEALREAGVSYRGPLDDANAPGAYARSAIVVHVPAPGGPMSALRILEPLACGTPLVLVGDAETPAGLAPGRHFLAPHDGEDMKRLAFDLLWDRAMAAEFSDAALAAVRAEHSCARRVEDLFEALRSFVTPAAPALAHG